MALESRRLQERRNGTGIALTADERRVAKCWLNNEVKRGILTEHHEYLETQELVFRYHR